MTSFTKHRRQPTGKSLVRLKLKVTSLLARVWADLLQNVHVYFWSLKINAVKTKLLNRSILEDEKAKYKQKTVFYV